MSTLFNRLITDENLARHLTSELSLRIFDESELWLDDPEEFVEVLLPLINSKEGTDFLSFLFGVENVVSLIQEIIDSMDTEQYE